MSEPRRDKPPIAIREHILIEQRGACFWCLLPLDSTVWLSGRSIDYDLRWDHAVPYVYLQASPDDNWVASCQVCNSIKSDSHFGSVELARTWIQARRDRLGYSLTRPDWREAARPAATGWRCPGVKLDGEACQRFRLHHAWTSRRGNVRLTDELFDHCYSHLTEGERAVYRQERRAS